MPRPVFGAAGSRDVDVAAKQKAWDAAQAGRPEPAAEASITLDFKMATELLEMFGDEPTEITLQHGDGYSGKGVYAHYTDMPEYGAEFLGVSDDEALPVLMDAWAEPAHVPQAHQIAEPALSGVTDAELLKLYQGDDYGDTHQFALLGFAKSVIAASRAPDAPPQQVAEPAGNATPQQVAEPAGNATPRVKGIYAWVPENGPPALLLVNKRPSSHSPGGILNAHVLQSPSFYDGCPVSQWGPGCWILLRSFETKREQS